MFKKLKLKKQKKTLLQKLKKTIKHEDDFLAEYKPALVHKVHDTIGLSEEEKKVVLKVLRALLSDTERHRATVEKLVEQVEKAPYDGI